MRYLFARMVRYSKDEWKKPSLLVPPSHSLALRKTIRCGRLRRLQVRTLKSVPQANTMAQTDPETDGASQKDSGTFDG